MIKNVLYFYALGIWFVMMLSAILNGILREYIISENIGDYFGHVISVVILSFIIFILTFYFLKSISIPYKNIDLWLIGIMWLTMTVSFEFIFGYFIIGHSINFLLADYNILKGRLWIIILIITLISPILCGLILQKT